MHNLTVIAHNIRSTHNIGSLLRTCEGLGIKQVYLTGYSPYPRLDKDDRLPYIINKLTKQIEKTALGSEKLVSIHHNDDIVPVIEDLKNQGYSIIALEQTKTSIKLNQFKPKSDIALILGNEVDGIDDLTLNLVDLALEIPMKGKKESFNVVQAAAMALYVLSSD